jgi:hypothetical protein
MTRPRARTQWWDKLLSTLHFFLEGRFVLVLRNAFDGWELVGQLRDKIGYHGMYEVLEYDATLEIMDAKGEAASLTRHEVIRLLQDNVVALHDHAWGDGELFEEYQCQPGVPVDFYKDGSKYNILISLRETKNRGDVIDLWIERVIKGGYLEQDEWLETEVDHWTEHLKLSVIFPQERPCQRATVTQRSTDETTTLDGRHFATLSDGRQILTWEMNRPKLHDRYTIKWRW